MGKLLQSCVDSINLNISMPAVKFYSYGDGLPIDYYPIAKGFYEYFNVPKEKFSSMINFRRTVNDKFIFQKLANASGKKRLESQFKGTYLSQPNGFLEFRTYLKILAKEKIKFNISLIEVGNDFEREIVFQAMKTALFQVDKIENLGVKSKIALFLNHYGRYGFSYSNETRGIKIYDKLIELDNEGNATKKELYFKKFPDLKNKPLIHRLEIGYYKTNEIKKKELQIGNKKMKLNEALQDLAIDEQTIVNAINQHFFENFKFDNRNVNASIKELLI